MESKAEKGMLRFVLGTVVFGGALADSGGVRHHHDVSLNFFISRLLFFSIVVRFEHDCRFGLCHRFVYTS